MVRARQFPTPTGRVRIIWTASGESTCRRSAAALLAYRARRGSPLASLYVRRAVGRDKCALSRPELREWSSFRLWRPERGLFLARDERSGRLQPEPGRSRVWHPKSVAEIHAAGLASEVEILAARSRELDRGFPLTHRSSSSSFEGCPGEGICRLSCDFEALRTISIRANGARAG